MSRNVRKLVGFILSSIVIILGVPWTAHSAPYVSITKAIRTNSDYPSSNPYDYLAQDDKIDLTDENSTNGSRDVIFRVRLNNTGTTVALVSIDDNWAEGNYTLIEASRSFESISVPVNGQSIIDYRARYVGSSTSNGAIITNTARIKWIDDYYNENLGIDYGGHGNLTSSKSAYLYNPPPSPPSITGKSLSTNTAAPGQTITFNYTISNPNSFSMIVRLGASIKKSGTSTWLEDYSHDEDVTLPPGSSNQFRSYQIPPNGNDSTPAEPGTYDVRWVVLETQSPWNQYDAKTGTMTVSSPTAVLDNGIVRVVVDLNRGGAIVEISHQGYNLIDTNDPGRYIQASLWDGEDFDEAGNLKSDAKWNPIQAGDRTNNNNPVIEYQADSNSIYTKAQGINWLNTGPVPQLLDVYIEQWVTLEDQKVKVRYLVTHFGSDDHALHHQEFPAVYLRAELSDCITYQGDNPWNSDTVSHLGLGMGQSAYIRPIEHWVSFAQGDTFGLTVYSPYHTLLWKVGHPSGEGNPSYIAVVDQFDIKSESVHETEVYFIVGNWPDSRSHVYDLESQNDAPKISHIDPQTVEPSDFTLKIAGNNFQPNAIDQIYWKEDSHFVGQGVGQIVNQSGTELVVTERLAESPKGTYLVTVRNPDGKLSNFVPLVITQPATLIRRQDDYKVYYVSGTTKGHIPDPETFEILRFNWGAIRIVTLSEFNSYTEIPPIPVLRSGSARDGSMVMRGTKDSIYVYLIEDGILKHIPDPDTLYAMGRTFDEVIELDEDLFDRIPKGPELPSTLDDSFIYFLGGLGLSGAAGYALDVNTAIGNYTYQKTDLAIPGRGLPFIFATAYNARAPYNPKSPVESYIMGPGWTHSFNMSATEAQQNGTNLFVRIKWGDGHEEHYKWDGGLYKGSYGEHNVIAGGGGSSMLTLTTKAQVKYSFTLAKSNSYPSTNFVTNVYRLSSIADRNSNTISLNYDANGYLTSVIDTVGRTVNFVYDASHRLIKVQDIIGRTVEFNYDAEGRLEYSKDLNGKKTTFTYKTKNGLTTPLIATITDPRENPYVSNTYTEGITNSHYKKASEVTVGPGMTSKIIYSDIGDTSTVTDPLQNAVIYSHSNNRLTNLADAKGSITIAYYDDLTNFLDPKSITDRRTNPTGFTYDSNGNILTITDPLNNIISFEYDSMNNIKKKTDALDRVTTYTYDARGNLTRIAAPIGTIDITNNTYGQPETVIDPNGNTTTYVYDSHGNPTEIKEPLGRITKFTYDSAGRKTSETDANNNTTYFTYDGNNNLLTIKNALDQTVTYQYDDNGNRTEVIDQNSYTTKYTYDERNRLTKVADPEGGETKYSHDVLDRLIQNTDAMERVTEYKYDEVGNLIKITDAENGSITYTYDENGNRLSMTDPNGKTTNYSYDELNRLKLKTEPLQGQWRYEYDEVGNMTSIRDAKNNTKTYSYDAMNRLKTVRYPDNSTVNFTYDSNGNRKSMTNSLGTTYYEYDALNRMTKYTDPFGKSVQYTYDANGNRKSMTYPDGKLVQYGYDELNRLKSVTDWLNRTTTYSYDAAGRFTGLTNPNNTTASYAYDKANRLTALINGKSDSTIISSYSYILDAVGNHISSTQTEPLSPIIPNQNISYSYDAENRLTSAGGVTFTYDANGNMVGRGSDSFSYDYRDKLLVSIVGGVTSQYAYDGFGNRLVKTENGVVRRYVLDVNTNLPNILAETDGSGNIIAYYVHGIGLISRILPDGRAHYYHYDSRGSTIALSDANQNITDAYAYNTFGKVANINGSLQNTFRYVGRYGVMDEGNGLYFIRARYYAPEIGRFITKDQHRGYELIGPELNKYIYTTNNPLTLIDVNGQWSWDITEGIKGIVEDVIENTGNKLYEWGLVNGQYWLKNGVSTDVGAFGYVLREGTKAFGGLSTAFDMINDAKKELNFGLKDVGDAWLNVGKNLKYGWQNPDAFADAIALATAVDLNALVKGVSFGFIKTDIRSQDIKRYLEPIGRPLGNVIYEIFWPKPAL